MSRRVPLVVHGLAGLLASLVVMPSLARAAEPARTKPLEMVFFEKILARHQDMTYEQLQAKLGKDRQYLAKLSFDPARVAHFDRVNQKLQLTESERGLLRTNGLVSLDLKRRHSFASAYYQIYAQDLPVLVTTDSILHALHRSYDDILMELETTLFTWTISQVLDDGHRALAERAEKNQDPALAPSYLDADLYLTVARNLMAGAGAPEQDPDSPPWLEPQHRDIWKGDLLVPARRGTDAEALARLENIQALKIQVPFQHPPTRIYGGERFIDWSQFKPRGHYTKSPSLKRYFRTLMWLGRIDCGWNVLPTDPQAGIKSDSDRELRNAVLLVELLRSSDSLKRLQAMDDIVGFMVGRSDNLTVNALVGLLRENKIQTLADAGDAQALARLKEAIRKGKHAQQMIRSQSIVSDPNDPYSKVAPPSTFQMFGQRFIIDSFVLSKVVFDTIVFRNRKQRRMMPTGLDVMAALGNNEAVPLLSADLNQWHWSGNLMACREFVDAHRPEFWKANLYNLWLDALRTLDDDMSSVKNFRVRPANTILD